METASIISLLIGCSIFCLIAIANITGWTMLFRLLINKDLHRRAQKYFEAKGSGIEALFRLLIKIAGFQFWENLGHKSYLSDSLRRHIRSYRYLFYAVITLYIGIFCFINSVFFLSLLAS